MQTSSDGRYGPHGQRRDGHPRGGRQGKKIRFFGILSMEKLVFFYFLGGFSCIIASHSADDRHHPHGHRRDGHPQGGQQVKK